MSKATHLLNKLLELQPASNSAPYDAINKFSIYSYYKCDYQLHTAEQNWVSKGLFVSEAVLVDIPRNYSTIVVEMGCGAILQITCPALTNITKYPDGFPKVLGMCVTSKGIGIKISLDEWQRVSNISEFIYKRGNGKVKPHFAWAQT